MNPQVRKGFPVEPQVKGPRGKFVQDFVAAWVKVSNLDRFDLA